MRIMQVLKEKMGEIKFSGAEVYLNNESSISLGEKTLMFFEDNIPLSPEKIGQLSVRDNAMYGASLSCGANCFALGIECENSSAGINDIASIKKLYESSNSCSDILVNLSAFDLCFLTSLSKNSGATNSNLLRMALNKKTECVTPLFISEDITTLASTTNLLDIFYNQSYLCDNDVLILSDNSSACDCVNLDFETACLNLTILESLSFSKLLINIDTSMLGNALNSDSSSLGILTFSSAMKKDKRENYLNVSNKFVVINSSRSNMASIDNVSNLHHPMGMTLKGLRRTPPSRSRGRRGENLLKQAPNQVGPWEDFQRKSLQGAKIKGGDNEKTQSLKNEKE